MLSSLFGGEAEGKRAVYDLRNTSVLLSRSMVMYKGNGSSGSRLAYMEVWDESHSSEWRTKRIKV